MSMAAPEDSGNRFELLVQNVTDYAIYMLSAQGIVVSWNAGARRFNGYEAEEIIGQHFSRFYTPEDQAAGIPALALRTAEHDGRFEAEGWRVRKDGTRFWANVVIDPIRDSAGELVGFAKVTRDLTEKREAQLALEQAREAIFQSQKMDAIGKLTGGVAHDFNNLLAVIVGSLDLAKQRLANGVDVSRYIDNAMTAAERGATLTQRMLAFARKQELKLRSVDCMALVRDMADLLKTRLGMDVAIETRFPLHLAAAHADPAQLELALLNLAVNARDAMPGGGRIIIEGSEANLLKAQRPDLESGHYVRLSIIDEGEGMDQATLDRAREPFFTTKGIGKGTGLGLSMVHGFAQQCGGSLTIQSEPGRGTTVSLWLPVAPPGAAVEEVAETADPMIMAPVEPLVILAVDDDDLVLTNTAGMLEALGHTVFQAGSGIDALRMLAQGSVDLVITDYAMPGMNGAQLADAIEERLPGLPVVIITGFAELPPHMTRRPRLDKPFKQAELARMVIAASQGSQRLVRLASHPDDL